MKAIVLFCLLAYFGVQVSGNINTPYPSAFDLRQVYPECSFAIYEEGVCTGNWAIAIADALSDLTCIQKTNVPSPLSPQQILDCVDYADNSCTNIATQGTLEDALTYLIQNSLQTTTCYPYNSEFTGVRQTCQGTCEDGSAFVNGTTNAQSYVTLQTNEDIMSFIMSQGSAIAMFPIASDFLLYDYGVFVPAANAHPIGNHVVKLIGWGTDSTTQQQYWIASNSWSINWGLQGYFYIYQNAGLITQAYGIYV